MPPYVCVSQHPIKQTYISARQLSAVTEKIKEDELKKFTFYPKRKSESAQNQHDSDLTALIIASILSHQELPRFNRYYLPFRFGLSASGAVNRLITWFKHLYSQLFKRFSLN